jgi:hypothetical protein
MGAPVEGRQRLATADLRLWASDQEGRVAMSGDEIISPRAPAAQPGGQPDTYYIRKAAGVLRSASSSHGRFTVTGRLAFELAKQRTPRNEDRSWNERALRHNIARALAEIDTYMSRATGGDEAAKERIRQLRVEAGNLRQAGEL